MTALVALHFGLHRQYLFCHTRLAAACYCWFIHTKAYNARFSFLLTFYHFIHCLSCPNIDSPFTTRQRLLSHITCSSHKGNGTQHQSSACSFAKQSPQTTSSSYNPPTHPRRTQQIKLYRKQLHQRLYQNVTNHRPFRSLQRTRITKLIR
jgi:hypothetical protein